MCVSDNSGVDTTDFYGHSSATANGSWDWNCDGKTTVALNYGCSVNSCVDPADGTFTDADSAGDCNGNQASVQNAACATKTTQLACLTFFTRSCGFALNGGFDADKPSYRGKPFDSWNCEWSAGKYIA